MVVGVVVVVLVEPVVFVFEPVVVVEPLFEPVEFEIMGVVVGVLLTDKVEFKSPVTAGFEVGVGS